MKRNIARIAVLVTAAVMVLTVTNRLIGAGAEAPVSPAATQSSGTGYIVRTYNGKVALFTGEFTDTPAVETDIDAEGLRAYDKQLLEGGIELATYEDVLRLLEDFGS